MDVKTIVIRADRLHSSLLWCGGLILPESKFLADEARSLQSRYRRKAFVWPCDILPAAVAALTEPRKIEGTRVAIAFLDRCAHLNQLRHASSFILENVTLPGYLAMEVVARIPLVLESSDKNADELTMFARVPNLGLSEFEVEHGLHLYSLANSACREIGTQLRSNRIARLCDSCGTLMFPKKSWGRFCRTSCRVAAGRNQLPSMGERRAPLQDRMRLSLPPGAKSLEFLLPRGMTITISRFIDRHTLLMEGDPVGERDEDGKLRGESVTIWTEEGGWKLGTFGFSDSGRRHQNQILLQ